MGSVEQEGFTPEGAESFRFPEEQQAGDQPQVDEAPKPGADEPAPDKSLYGKSPEARSDNLVYELTALNADYADPAGVIRSLEGLRLDESSSEITGFYRGHEVRLETRGSGTGPVEGSIDGVQLDDDQVKLLFGHLSELVKIRNESGSSETEIASRAVESIMDGQATEVRFDDDADADEVIVGKIGNSSFQFERNFGEDSGDAGEADYRGFINGVQIDEKDVERAFLRLYDQEAGKNKMAA